MTDFNLLCKPFGGLNDTLEQINKCFKYAIQYNRTLFIDTNESGLMSDFSLFFEFNKGFKINIVTNVGENEYMRFNRMETNPIELKGCVNQNLIYSQKKRNFIEKNSEKLITFDFNVTHSEELLIHAQDGDVGDAHQSFLTHLKIKNNLIDKINNLRKDLPSEYISIHIRNTDYQTDYKSFFSNIEKMIIGKNIFISSDDKRVIDFGINFFKNSKVFSTHRTVDLMGTPLHNRGSYSTDSERAEATREAIRDMILLALGSDFYFTNTTTGIVSGYSRLVQYINNNKYLIKSLLKKND